MLNADLRKKIEYIKIMTRKKTSGSFSGGYLSAFRGRGIEFEEVREYAPGDDYRAIDWNVTAKTGKPHIKRFAEERELTLFFAVDVSGSADFGTGGKTKKEVAAEMVCALAFAAGLNRDRTGLLLFSDRSELCVAPSKGEWHYLRLTRDLLAFECREKKTSISAALTDLDEITSKRAVVFLFSDFIDSGWERALKQTAVRHDLIPVVLRDPAELRLPSCGLMEFADGESGQTVFVDTASPAVRRRYEETAARRDRELMKKLRKCGADPLLIETDRDWIDPLRRLFFGREHRFREGV